MHMQASFRTKKKRCVAVYHRQFALCPSQSLRRKKKCRIRSWAAVAAYVWFGEIRERAPGIKKSQRGTKGCVGNVRVTVGIEPDCVNTCTCTYISPGNWKSINAELGRKVKSPMNVSRRAIFTWDVCTPSSRYRNRERLIRDNVNVTEHSRWILKIVSFFYHVCYSGEKNCLFKRSETIICTSIYKLL